MAVLYRHYEPVGKPILAELRRHGIPASWKDQVRFGDTQDTVRVLPFHSSKGLEFPFVVIPGAGMIASSDATNEDEARLLYVAMTRAMDQLVVTGSTDRQ
jgi:superfamily I DNA/RNA helicase